MDKIISEVETILQGSNGSMPYRELYGEVSSNAQRKLYPALREAKRQKRLVLANPVDTETGRATFVVSLVIGGGA
ncbi:hypothetical protein LCGC14_1130160 [marine sediment metagenome]|uniref:Uncharacterized protein n=1 Tax=marine sediment metagenome TaxID=412755 RepID=A0A0F9MP50_9ZZZZ